MQLLELAWTAQKLFERRLLNFVQLSCTWEDGKAVASFRQTFDLLAETAADAARAAPGDTAKTAKLAGGLGPPPRRRSSSQTTVVIDFHPRALYLWRVPANLLPPLNDTD